MQKEPEYQTTRIWKETHKRLRLIAAMTGESQVEALDRMTKEELQRIQRRQGRKSGAHE